MSETTEIIVGLFVLAGVYIFTRRFHAWRLKQTYLFIIKDLKEKQAFSPESAAKLPYAKVRLFRIGTRDYRPKALQHLTMSDIIRKTENGGYYLKDRDTPDNLPRQ